MQRRQTHSNDDLTSPQLNFRHDTVDLSLNENFSEINELSVETKPPQIDEFGELKVDKAFLDKKGLPDEFIQSLINMPEL